MMTWNPSRRSRPASHNARPARDGSDELSESILSPVSLRYRRSRPGGRALQRTAPAMINPLRVMFIISVLLVVGAVTGLLVAGLDEGFNPCPIKKNIGTVCSKKSASKNSKSVCRTTWLTFDTFCGETMHPRVTTCCRVPCFQNFTTYFDSDGNPADCYSQPWQDFAISTGMWACLAVGLAFWIAFFICCRIKSYAYLVTFDVLVLGREPIVPPRTISEKSSETVPDNVESKVTISLPPEGSDAEQVQVV